MRRQKGFSLPETLVALLLFAISMAVVMKYQLALVKGFQLQVQQREAWRYASQLFEGYQPPHWHTQLSHQSAVAGCIQFTATVISPLGRKAELSRLRCPLPGE